MKVLSLISTALLALSLAGAVQAQPAAPETSNIAPATIIVAPCESTATTPCRSDTPAAESDDAEDHAVLPPTDPKQRQQEVPAAPVPEPETFVMLMLGLVVLGVASRRRQATDKFD